MTKPARRLPLKSGKPAFEASYRVDAAAQFALKRGRQIVGRGHGTIVTLSQHELAFHAEARIPAGIEIEFDVPWPGCERLLVLKLTGRTVRNDGSLVTVRLVAHKFQTLGSLPRKAPVPWPQGTKKRVGPNTAPVTV